jgi:ribonuclease P protein component
MSCPPRRYRFTHAHRLHGAPAFSAVFAARARKVVGPLVVHAKPNDLHHPRLGLSVPRRVGNAVVRNRIKRLLREAFRLLQHDFPHGYDVVVAVRPSEPSATPTLADYQRMLFNALRSLHLQWQHRRRKAGQDPP